jgi:hypothetical protein
MSVFKTQGTRWTTSDIAPLPDNGTNYESIDRELYMSGQPHWHHQRTCGNLHDWCVQQLEIHWRDQAMLHLIATLFAEDVLTSPWLPGFSCPVARLFT